MGCGVVPVNTAPRRDRPGRLRATRFGVTRATSARERLSPAVEPGAAGKYVWNDAMALAACLGVTVSR